MVWVGLGWGVGELQVLIHGNKSPEPGCCSKKICSIDDWGFFIMRIW